MRGINGEPTDPWYLMGAASLAALLLPFVATPLAWVAVEVLRKQADNASSNLSLPTQQPATLTHEQAVKKHSRVMSVLVPAGDSSPGAVTSEHDITEVDNLPDRRPTIELKNRNIEFLDAEVYVKPHRIDGCKFQSLNTAACAMLYIALMCFSFSIVCCKLSLHALLLHVLYNIYIFQE